MADENRVIEALTRSFSAKDNSLEIIESEGIVRGSFLDKGGKTISFKLTPEPYGAVIDFGGETFFGADAKKLVERFEYDLEQSLLRNVRVESVGAHQGLSIRLEY